MPSAAGSDSSLEPVPISDSFAAMHAPPGGASQVWLDGDVLACACPDCNAPMSIRLWLRLAECRMCGTQVELSEEIERLAQQLMAQRERGGPWSDPVAARSPLRPLPLLRPPGSVSAAPPPLPAKPKPEAVVPTPPKPAAAPAPRLVAEPVYEVAGDSLIAQAVAARPAAAPQPPPPVQPGRSAGRQFLDQIIACLVSMVVHMVIIILLGLLTHRQQKPPRPFLEIEVSGESAGPQGGEIVLSSKVPEPAGKQEIAVSTTPKSVGLQITEMETRRGQLAAKVQAIVVRPNIAAPSAPGFGSSSLGTLISGRSPTVRERSLVEEGGNERSELAVAMGLKWIAKHQNRDGSWSLEAFPEAGDCGGRCTAAGFLRSDTGGTALALLPFLGAGHTHRDGDYQQAVDDGLNFLIRSQGPSGSLMGDRGGGATMYSHGLGAIALCEAYAMTNDSKLRAPAQKAIDFIVAAQHLKGGWRYDPGDPGDTSVVGWQLMALRSARMSDLNVPPEVLEKATQFLDDVQMNERIARFGYLPGSGPTEAMTAEGMLCRLYQGWPTNHPPLVAAADYLLQHHKPLERSSNMYYWYYATQVMHHMGGARWKGWNERMRNLLIELQETKGHEAGSWTPVAEHDPSGGRLYMTALAVCTLEVYYRYLPLYKQRALDAK